VAFLDELWFRSEDPSAQQLIKNVAGESCWLVFHGKVEPLPGVPVRALAGVLPRRVGISTKVSVPLAELKGAEWMRPEGHQATAWD
jgi:hypothetical protein